MIRVPVILLALTVHEFSHAYFALRMGDPTAYRLGRCTLNPLKHLDFLGTLCLLFAPIGWAKPVPVNPMNFRDRRKGIIVSTAAGPLSNLAQAIVFALLLRGTSYFAGYLPDTPQSEHFLDAATHMFLLGVLVNVGLAVFNFLPLFPLDGFHVSLQFMRPETQQRFAQTAMYGPFVILGIVLLGNHTDVDFLGQIIGPAATFLLRHVAGLNWV